MQILERLPDWFTSHPLAQIAARDHAAELLEDRRAGADRVRALESERERLALEFRAADAGAKEKVDRAREPLAAAEQARRDLRSAHQARALRLDGLIRRERGALIEGAPPEHKEFDTEMHRLLEATRRSISGKNMMSAERRIAAIRAAIEAAEALQLEACEDIPGRIARIRATIPELVFETVNVVPRPAIA